MAVSFVSFTHVNGTTAAISTGSITVAAGQSLVACAHWAVSVVSVTSIKWNTTETFTQAGTGRLFYLKNPTATTSVVTLTLSADPAGRLGLSVWVVGGMDQTTCVRTATTGTTDPGSSVGDLVVGGMTANWADTNTWSANASATEDTNSQTNVGSGSGSYWMLAEHEAGAAGTTPMAFQHLTSDGNAVLSADFVALIPAAGGGSATSGAGNNIRRRLAA